MKKRVCLAFASGILLVGMPALPAMASELATPSVATVRLLPVPDGTPVAQETPANEGSSSGVRVNPSNSTLSGQTLAATAVPGPPRAGPLYDLGTFLLAHGINLHPTFIDRFGANPSSGIDPGNTYNFGILALNADVDLQRLMKLPGANIHVGYYISMFKGNNPDVTDEEGGFLTGFQTTPAFVATRLSLLTYEQKLFDNRLSIEGGRTNLYRYFMLNNSLDPFNSVSSTFGIDADAAPFMNPTWGGRIKYNLNPFYYIQAGAFEDDWIYSVKRPFDLNTENASGAQVLAELGYRSDFDTASYPGNFEIGIEDNTRNGYSNFKGEARPAQVTVQKGSRTIITDFTATDYGGGQVFFTQGKRVLWRSANNPGGQPQNIAVYGSFDVALSQPQPIDMDAIGGIDFTGFIPHRPADAFEFQVHYQLLSQIEANFETASQIKADGPGPSQSRNNVAFQVTDNVQVTDAIAIRPFAQYFVNADSYYVPSGRSQNGWGVGILASISFGRLLGLSPL